jgi:hypothetical protein
MFIRKIGQRHAVYEQPGEGAPASGTGEAAHPVEAPWQGAEGVWTLGEGETAQPWYATIPEEAARKHVEAKGYANPAELALANYNLTKLQRGADDVIALPGEGATEDQMAEFYSRLGRPQEPGQYEIKFGEGAEPDPKLLEAAQTLFHKAGLTSQQAQAVAAGWDEVANARVAEVIEQAEQENTQALQELQQRWGANLEANKAAGRRVIDALQLSEDLMQKVENAMGVAPVVELLAAIGTKAGEGSLLSSDTGGDPNNPDTMSKDQATAKITELQGDADFQKKYTDANHPGHRDAVRLMERLFART